MLKLLECKRSEDNTPFDAVTAQKYADELYSAGGARNIGERKMINTVKMWREGKRIRLMRRREENRKWRKELK